LGKKHVYNRHTKSSPHACSSPPFASVSTTAAIVKWSELPLLSPSEPSKRGGLHTVFLLSYCICALDIVKVDGSSPFNPMKATHCEWFFVAFPPLLILFPPHRCIPVPYIHEQTCIAHFPAFQPPFHILLKFSFQ